MNRPIITEFLGDGIELEEAHEIYKKNPELWNYIQAQDKFIDQIDAENEHLRNYADHTQFCSWKYNGNGICDCGYRKQKLVK